MPNLYWSPLSINSLLQLLFSATITLYLLARLVRAWRAGGETRPHYLPLWFIGSICLGAAAQMLSQVLAPEHGAWVLPWVGPFGSSAMMALVLYSENLTPHRVLPRVVSRFLRAALFALVVLEILIAIERTRYLHLGEVHFRDAWVDIPATLGFAAAGILAYLQLRSALALVQGGPGPLSALLKPHHPLTGNVAASRARGFFYVILGPVVLALVLLARSFGWVDWQFAETFASWTVMVVLCWFAWVYLTHLPDQTRTTTKITGLVLVAVLMLISAVSWLVAPAFVAGYADPGAPRAGQAVRFTPQDAGGYGIEGIAARRIPPVTRRLEPAGEGIALPFTLPILGQDIDRLYVRDTGVVGLGAYPFQPDIQFHYGPSPAIFVLAADLAPSAVSPDDSGVFVDIDDHGVTVSWARMTIQGAPDQIYDAQLRIESDGTIEIAHHVVPDALRPNLYRADAIAMMVGLTPGSRHGQVEIGPLPGQVLPPGIGAVDDRRPAFRTLMTLAFGPVAMFLCLAVPSILIFFPALVHYSVSRPLSAISAGVERFRSGALREPIRVFSTDEIGAVARAFNDMAEERERFLQSLEAEVEKRSAEAVELSANNVRLREREELGRDLHDAVSQTLFAASLIADTVPRLMKNDPARATTAIRQVGVMNREALVEMRHLLKELRPQHLLSIPFNRLLQGIPAEIESRYALQVEVVIENDADLPEDVQIAFFRVAHGAITNVARHARVDRARVVFDAVEGQAMLIVSDQGVGFDPDAVPFGHHGLEIMRERLDKLGGLLEVETAPDTGCTVTAIWFSDDASDGSTTDAG